TVIDEDQRGQGLATALIRAALDATRTAGKSVVPQCPAVAGFIAKHSGYHDLVPADRRAEFGIGCPLPPALTRAVRAGRRLGRVTEQPSTLAIVGGGPRAVYALEALARRAADRRLPSRIDVYEPRPQLGTGMAYAPDQPDWVSLNIPDHALHAGRVHTGAALVDSPLVGPF